MNRHGQKKQNYPPDSTFSVWRQIIIPIFLISNLLLVCVSPSLAANEKVGTDARNKVAIGAASLILQPFYLAVKLAVGVTGTAISGLTLLGTGGNEEIAGQIFQDSWASPWGMPELFETHNNSE